MSNTEQFKHPTMHVLSASGPKLVFTEVFADGRWLDDGQVFSRAGIRYKVVKQDKGVHNYYVWVVVVE